MDIEAFMRREKMLKLREELLTGEEDCLHVVDGRQDFKWLLE